MNSLAVLTTLFSRLPSNALAGRQEVARKIVIAAGDFHEALTKIDRNGDLSPGGRAKALAPLVRDAARQLARFQRQTAHLAQLIANAERQLHAKAIGERDPDDAERRAVLRQMPEGDRVQTVLRDRAMRAAALRLRECSGCNAEILDRALGLAIAETAPAEADAIEVDREAHEILRNAVEVFAAQLRGTAVVVDPISNEPRAFSGDAEFRSFIADGAVAPMPRDTALEEAELEAAA